MNNILPETRRIFALTILAGLLHLNLSFCNAERFDYHSIHRPPNPATPNGHFEGETHFEQHGNARPQDMRHYGPDWSGDTHLLWDGPIGESARVSIRVKRTSKYQLTAQFTRAPDYGVFQVFLDGKPIGGEIDTYSAKVDLAPLTDFGDVDLEKGQHVISFKLVRGNENAKPFRKGFLLGLDFVELKDLTPLPRPTIAKQPPTATPPEQADAVLDMASANALLKKYCLACHQGDEPEGDLSFAEHDNRAAFLTDLESTEKIADALLFATMPPEDEPQLSRSERRQLAAFFDSLIHESSAKSESLAPVVMRRLTRYEYNNAVRDLLNLKGDIYPLPERTLRAGRAYFDPATGVLPDVITVGNRTLGKNQVEKQILDGVSPYAIDLQAEHGFNNRGDQLSISPLLLETFVQLAESIVTSPQFEDYCQSYHDLFVGTTPPDPEKDQQLGSQRIPPLLARAFRSSPSEKTVARYMSFFKTEYDRSSSYSASMKKTVAAILSSPRFLYLTKSSPSKSTTDRLTDYELATQLSFFLWSTIPDQTLLDLAAEQRLNDPTVLRQQVERMLLDKRCQALSENFARQWMRLDQLITAVPDFERFPRYYARIGCEQWKLGLQSMVEPLLLFESILVEDRSIMLLIDSNYTYRSDELQSWYTDETPFNDRGNVNRFNTNQQNFVRRDVTSRREGGIITTSATMTMTSSPLRTSPITRGSWVATVVLNQPPEPPPDVVPEIEADDAEIEAQGITLRQRLKQHQENESCVACHAKIDPLGFVLENYDAVGRWRDTYRSGLSIDASGKLFGEAEFDDIESFKDVLLDRPEIFMRGFSEHLLSYALGRALRPADKPTVDRIVRRVEEDHGRFSTLVNEIVMSRPFRHKSTQNNNAPPN